MKICDLHTGRIRLTRAVKQLREQWAATSEHWQDANRNEFEQNHLQLVAPQVTLLVAAVERLADVLRQVERDCREESEEGE
jgi:hypothetical protein